MYLYVIPVRTLYVLKIHYVSGIKLIYNTDSQLLFLYSNMWKCGITEFRISEFLSVKLVASYIAYYLQLN